MDQTNQFGTSQKIVIVEDNVSLADIYKIRLELLGYTCFVAYDGQTALELIERELPDLVLLDLMVPKVAGDQILSIMRASEWGKHIKVQIISNLNEADAPAGLRQQGIEGYAVKANLSNDQLDLLVDSILKPADQQEDVSLEVKTSEASSDTSDSKPILFTGLKSVVYPSANLEADKVFWTKATGVKPYFEQAYYVGFMINGGELGLDPNAAKQGLTYPVAYWHVSNVAEAVKQLAADGVTVNAEPKDVGGGMMVATLKDASGNIFGIIDDPRATS
jgi:CheY-like chemotaxis protein